MAKHRQLAAFGKAVTWGAMVGAALPLVAALIGLIVTSKAPGGADMTFIAMAFLSVGLAYAIVTAAAIVFGLPLTYALWRLGRESWWNYAFSGAAIGFALPMLIAEGRLSDGISVAVLCGCCGGVTGSVWWVEARAPLYAAGH